MILLDTHIWIWFIDDPDQLSEKARAAIETARNDGGAYVSSISTWEVYMLTTRGLLSLRISPDLWVTRCERLSFLHFLPVDNEIARLSVDLPGHFHNDPADRMIVASALFLGVPLITKDVKIHSYTNVQTIW